MGELSGIRAHGRSRLNALRNARIRCRFLECRSCSGEHPLKVEVGPAILLSAGAAPPRHDVHVYFVGDFSIFHRPLHSFLSEIPRVTVICEASSSGLPLQSPKMSFETSATIASFGGQLLKLSHKAKTTGCEMKLNLYLPPQSKSGKVPVLFYLSGLTCTGDNCAEKGFFQHRASQKGVAVVYPDTSPSK